MRLHFCNYLSVSMVVLSIAATSCGKAALAEGQNHANTFGLRLLQEVGQDEENHFFSPFSIRTALAMTALGAEGKTLKQMLSTLELTDAAAFGREGSALVRSITDSNTSLSLANGLWVEQGFPLLEKFRSSCQNDFGAMATAADFSGSPDVERITINSWIEKNTEGKIVDFFKPCIITTQTRMVLANAIYFKADWASPFSVDATQKGEFKNSDGTIGKADLMAQTSRFAYGDDADFQVLQMPYRGDRLAMVLLLPKNPPTMPLPADWVTSTTKIQTLIPTQVSVTLPKFQLRDQLDLASPLQKLGMLDAFDPKLANFSGMSAGAELYISAVVHEAFIDVDETGTEAAAATGVVMALRMAPVEPPVTFTADRPFWFFIHDTQTGTILFLGRLSKL